MTVLPPATEASSASAGYLLRIASGNPPTKVFASSNQGVRILPLSRFYRAFQAHAG